MIIYNIYGITSVRASKRAIEHVSGQTGLKLNIFTLIPDAGQRLCDI
jgi:hypothetical protein